MENNTIPIEVATSNSRLTPEQEQLLESLLNENVVPLEEQVNTESLIIDNNSTESPTNIIEESSLAPLIEEPSVGPFLNNAVIHTDNIIPDEIHSRFTGAPWYKEITKHSIIIAGLGGIGSFTAFILSRVNPKFITMFDPDSIEATNLSGQLFNSEDIGSYKGSTVCNFIGKYSDYNSVASFVHKYTATSNTCPIMICGFDNMEARKIYFNRWLDGIETYTTIDKKEFLFIDGRLAAESLQIFCIRGDDSYNINKYNKEYLFKDSEAEPTICSYKQTTYMASMIGSLITNIYINFITNLTNPIMEREVPFLTTYDAEFMHFKIIS